MADIVIIGGGVTGLSAGIHLLLDGGAAHRVTICEKHTVPGGNLTGWNRGGCHIDNCIHWLNGTNPTTKLYREWVRLGALEGVEIRKRDSLYTCRIGTDELSLWRDAGRIERAMLWYSPHDKREIHRLFRAVRTLQALSGLSGSDSEASSRSLSGLAGLMSYATLTTGELAERFQHPLVRQFLTAICDTSFSALAQLTIMAQFCGGNADLPVGGSAAMAERIAERFRSLGGTLRLGSHVESVELKCCSNGRRAVGVNVRQGGQNLRLPADYVIATADPATICGKILDVPLPAPLVRLYKAQPPRRFSAVHAAFVLPSERINFSDELSLPFPVREAVCPHGTSVLLREFTHEPDFAPPGYTVVQVMTLCNEEQARHILTLSRPEYLAFKQDVARVFTDILNDICPPAPGQDPARLLDVWTPATYRRFIGTEIGSFMSFIMTPQTVPHDSLAAIRERIRIGHPVGSVPDVENVLLAGQWLRVPGGLPIAAGEGQRAAEAARRFLRAQEPGRIHVRLAGAAQP